MPRPLERLETVGPSAASRNSRTLADETAGPPAAAKNTLAVAPKSKAGRCGVSVVISLASDLPDLERVHRAYAPAVEKIGAPYEFIYVISAAARESLAILEELQSAHERITVIVLRRWPGEARALTSGLQEARGDVIITLPPRLQVDPDEIPRVVSALESCEMAIARRSSGQHATGLRLREKLFHWLLKATFGHAFSDLMCRVRACRRHVLDEISLYGVHHHFSPLLALQRGFTIREVEVRPGTAKGSLSRSPWTYAGAMLDILALYVLLKFTRKPLRFFGLIGGPVLLAGFLYTAALAFGRMVYDVPLSNRPALILGILLIVLGIQIIALGLIGEIIIFASGKTLRDYSVEKIIGRRTDRRSGA